MDTPDDIEKQESPLASSSAAESASASLSGPSKSDCNFAWKDISFTVDTPSGKKQILQNVNGCVEKGTLSPVCG
jgi:hypothetical protein